MTKVSVKELEKVTLNVELKDVTLQLIRDEQSEQERYIEPEIFIEDGVLKQDVDLVGTSKQGVKVFFTVSTSSYKTLPSAWFIEQDGLWKVKNSRLIKKGSEVDFANGDSKKLEADEIWGGYGKCMNK